jgi:PAS domain S-box-containing protein
MQMHFSISKKLDIVWSNLPMHYPKILAAIPVICLVVPLVSMAWLRQGAIATRQAIEHPEQRLLETERSTAQKQQLFSERLSDRYQQLEQQHTTAIVAASVALTVGLLSSLATLYLFNQLHQELQERSRRLREHKVWTEAIADNTLDGIITLNKQGQIEALNATAMHMFGYEATEIMGKDLRWLLANPPIIATYEEQHKEQHKEQQPISHNLVPLMYQQKALGRRKVGTHFPVELSIREIPLDERLMMIVHDVTEREAAAAELRSQLNELSQTTTALMKSKADLQSIYMACLDLKAPLQAIVHLSEWIEADLSERVASDTYYQMNLLRERVRRMESLVDDIFQTSQVGH